MLQLKHIKYATQEDIDNNLVYWANLFMADTWESFKELVRNNPAIEEVGNLILELNTDNQSKEILEGQRRYKEMLASQYAAGYTDAEEKYSSAIADKDATIADLQSEIAKLKTELASNNK